MLNLGFGEIVVILALALVFVGPERLPHMVRWLGRQYGKLMRMSDELRRAFVLEADRMDAEDRYEKLRQRRDEARRRAEEARQARDNGEPEPEGAPSLPEDAAPRPPTPVMVRPGVPAPEDPPPPQPQAVTDAVTDAATDAATTSAPSAEPRSPVSAAEGGAE